MSTPMTPEQDEPLGELLHDTYANCKHSGTVCYECFVALGFEIQRRIDTKECDAWNAGYDAGIKSEAMRRDEPEKYAANAKRIKEPLHRTVVAHTKKHK